MGLSCWTSGIITRRSPRSPQRRLVAGGEHDVHLPGGEFAIGDFVSFNARRLDVLEYEILALLIAELGHPLLECGIMRRLSLPPSGWKRGIMLPLHE
jgi:hypothetical protein